MVKLTIFKLTIYIIYKHSKQQDETGLISAREMSKNMASEDQ